MAWRMAVAVGGAGGSRGADGANVEVTIRVRCWSGPLSISSSSCSPGPSSISSSVHSDRGLFGSAGESSPASGDAGSKGRTTSHAVGSMASRSMAWSSASGAQRLDRSGSSAERNAAVVPAGNPVRFALPAAARSNTAIIGLEPNTGAPVAANASTDATDHQSVISSDSAPSMISGAMNPGVPITRPVRVTWLSPSPIAMPKSTRIGPVAETITFVGLMSRWMIPAACTALTASISLRVSRSRSVPTYRPFAATSSRRFLPSISSVTMNASESSNSISTMPHTPGCCTRRSAIASRRRRSRAVSRSLASWESGGTSSSDSESRRIFMAYSCPPSSRTRHTEPIAPAPRRDISVYPPTSWPDSRFSSLMPPSYRDTL